MGSSQSAPSSTAPTQQTPIQPQQQDDILKKTGQDAPQQPKKKRNNKPKLEGFALVQRKCRKKKQTYDKCYAAMFGSFVAAKSMDSSSCDDDFEEWRLCILRGMKKEREKKGITAPVHKESMLAELEDDDE